MQTKCQIQNDEILLNLTVFQPSVQCVHYKLRRRLETVPDFLYKLATKNISTEYPCLMQLLLLEKSKGGPRLVRIHLVRSLV